LKFILIEKRENNKLYYNILIFLSYAQNEVDVYKQRITVIAIRFSCENIFSCSTSLPP